MCMTVFPRKNWLLWLGLQQKAIANSVNFLSDVPFVHIWCHLEHN
uniref:Uncharacterized protein n=1 Tax=Rhizophora mucronata TaxID=61149 RepID=A0A2P2L3D6_RHIMU